MTKILDGLYAWIMDKSPSAILIHEELKSVTEIVFLYYNEWKCHRPGTRTFVASQDLYSTLLRLATFYGESLGPGLYLIYLLNHYKETLSPKSLCEAIRCPRNPMVPNQEFSTEKALRHRHSIQNSMEIIISNAIKLAKEPKLVEDFKKFQDKYNAHENLEQYCAGAEALALAIHNADVEDVVALSEESGTDDDVCFPGLRAGPNFTSKAKER